MASVRASHRASSCSEDSHWAHCGMLSGRQPSQLSISPSDPISGCWTFFQSCFWNSNVVRFMEDADWLTTDQICFTKLMLKDLIQQHLSNKRMKYDLTRIVNESFTIELRLIATNFLRLVSWIPTWCVVAIRKGSELGCCCLTSWTQTLNWFTAPQHWLVLCFIAGQMKF